MFSLGPPSVESSPYPLREGNRATPWVDGIPFYERLFSVLEEAKARVFGVISFIDPHFCFPNGEPFWEVMKRCADRGVDVRLLFWKNPHFSMPHHIFQGTDEDRSLLTARAPNILVRWDASPDVHHCHHQKAWLIDQLGFVGGMVLSRSTLETQAHQSHPKGKHDIFVEVEGPALADLWHNFAQRWNFSKDSEAPWPETPSNNDLPLYLAPPSPCGASALQVTRTLRGGLYGQAAERDIWRQYQLAFASAKRSIYLENQHPGEETLLELLHDALSRGVRVFYLVPGEPMGAICRERQATEAFLQNGGERPRYASTFLALDKLSTHPNFTLAALSKDTKEIYTHAKVCIIDGAWTTIGSANLVDLSLCEDHTELNVSIWDQRFSLSLLQNLSAEHLGEPQDSEDQRLLNALQTRARENALRRRRGAPMRGHVYALSPRHYGITTGDDRFFVPPGMKG